MPSASPQFAAAQWSDAGASTAKMTFTIKIPKAPKAASAAQLHEWFVSASTQSISFAEYKANSKHTAANRIATFVYSLAAGAKGCAGPRGGARTCTASIMLRTPAVDLFVATFDKPPKGKSIPANAKQLAAVLLANQAVTNDGKLKFVLGGIPQSVVMTLPNATSIDGVQTTMMHGVAQLDQTIALHALDADGNTILTDNYVNAAGAPAAIAMSVTPSLKTCGSGVLEDGELAPRAKITVGAPPAGGIKFIYGETAVARPFATPGACSFAIKASVGSSTQRGSFVLTGPQVTLYPLGNSYEPQQLAVGPDRNIWFETGINSVGTINVTTKAVTTFNTGSATTGVVSGTDGNLWIAEYGEIEAMTTAGSIVHSYPYTNVSTFPSEQLAEDVTGNFWTTFSQGQNIMQMNAQTGTAQFYTPLTKPSPYPVGVTNGPDGNLWFTDCNALPPSTHGVIERISPQGTNRKAFSIPSSTGGSIFPTFIISGSDGNLWFTSCPARSITRMTTSGTFTTFSSPSTSGGYPVQTWGLANGPDNAIWFGNVDIANGSIQRIPTDATSASQITNFPTPDGGIVFWVTAGPDGAIWFVDDVISSSTHQFASASIGRMSL